MTARELVTGLVLTSLSMTHATEIIAHRGASHDAPENTVAAARLAWEQGADALECDIRLTSDGRIIVCHDDTARRTAGYQGEIARMTFDELRRLDAGAWKSPQFAGERLPGLEELLATVPAGKLIFIEIKDGLPTVEALRQVLADTGFPPEQTAVISFDREVVKAAKAALPQAAAYWIVDYKAYAPPPHTVDDLIRLCREGGLDGLDLSGRWPIDRTFTEKITAAGLRLYTWTIDDPARAKELAAAGVDGITTNRPGWLREQLK